VVDGQVVVSGAWTRSVDDVVAGAAQTTEDGAAGVVPRLGETQQVDSTVATQLDDVQIAASFLTFIISQGSIATLLKI